MNKASPGAFGCSKRLANRLGQAPEDASAQTRRKFKLSKLTDLRDELSPVKTDKDSDGGIARWRVRNRRARNGNGRASSSDARRDNNAELVGWSPESEHQRKQDAQQAPLSSKPTSVEHRPHPSSTRFKAASRATVLRQVAGPQKLVSSLEDGVVWVVAAGARAAALQMARAEHQSRAASRARVAARLGPQRHREPRAKPVASADQSSRQLGRTSKQRKQSARHRKSKRKLDQRRHAAETHATFTGSRVERSPAASARD